ncbi:MAG: molybdopterin-binding protein, partial [Planctomycetota bacterium]|nr:molybdopterin-binding protein [Planctomycetota bacterium]
MSHIHTNTFSPLPTRVLTVSDTRDLQSDKSGALIEKKLLEAGHQVVERRVVRDDIEAIREACLVEDINALIINGGTGVTPRDQTPEAVTPLFDKTLDGFGELFRQLSYAEIGASTIQSRATAGLISNCVVFVLPGSTNACRLAMNEIILPQLDSRTMPCSFSGLLGW